MDLLESLQRLGDAEHDDVAIAHEALNEMMRLRLLVAEQEGALYGLRAENERLRGLIKTYRNMLRYDWIAQQEKKIKELNAEIDALRGEGEK